MADVVTSQTIVDTVGTKTVMKFTNISDGSGETLVTKMDASALTFMTEDANRVLAKIYWSVNTIGFFSGRGFHDYFADGNSIPNNATLTANTSPAGDILFSTKGFVAGDNYTIILEIR
jgi:hypothetical protein